MDETFNDWMEIVDLLFANMFGGLTSEDFEDYNWYDMFIDGYDAQEAFDEFLAETIY